MPPISKPFYIILGRGLFNTKIEKRYRYSLGLGLENSILDFMEILVMAKSAPRTLKASYLLKGMGKLEISILKLRILLELKLVNETKLFQLQNKLAEIGRMLGGWLKSVQNT